jgi:predicted enzyme related to lactoylglutathione lyase
MNSRAACVDPRGGGPRLFFIKKEKTPTTSIPIHLDVAVEDIEAAVARFEALGAQVKERKTETLGPFTSSWTVMADPEGNGFCVQAAR